MLSSIRHKYVPMLEYLSKHCIPWDMTQECVNFCWRFYSLFILRRYIKLSSYLKKLLYGSKSWTKVEISLNFWAWRYLLKINNLYPYFNLDNFPCSCNFLSSLIIFWSSFLVEKNLKNGCRMRAFARKKKTRESSH